MIVDTHCHISAHWYEPQETLLYQMDRCGVDRAWLVQLLAVYDNTYQQLACRQHPDRFVSIVGVDWTQDDGVAQLARLAAEGARGVRLRPISRSPGDDPLAIWRGAQAGGLIVSCVGTAAQFSAPDFAEVVAMFPDLPIVLEHFGGLARPDVGDIVGATAAIAALARQPAIRLKLPGLGQLMPRLALATPPTDLDVPAALPIAALLAAFGPDRLMWASDFPVVSTREGYANALGWSRALIPAGVREAVFGGTAQQLMANQI